MPKNKRPGHHAPRQAAKSAAPPQVKEEQQSTELCALALDLAHGAEAGDIVAAETHADLAQKALEFQRQLRRLLAQNKDEVLYGAIELAREESLDAYRYLRNAIEEGAANLLLHREDGPDMEVDAFAIPVFVHSQGGLDPAADFQDGAAYDELVASFTRAGLESKHARVVLVSHAYDLGEMERISYGQLQAMLREAAQSMGGKKIAAAPALERSLAAGWSATSFGPDDSAVELRFLVGFAMKRADDAFYQAPASEKAADDYYAQRAARYQQWTEDYAPLVARCLGRGRGADARLRLNFLYQDLFFGARALAQSEYAMLGLLSELNAVLAQHAPEQIAAVISPADEDDDLALRVQLHAGSADGPLLVTAHKPLDAATDVALAIDDLRDALVSLGITDLSLADGPLA